MYDNIPRNNNKVYVSVKVIFTEDGIMKPKEITWEDGKKYPIDCVSDIRQATAMKAGGQGDRYTIHMGNHQSYLFFERSPEITGCCLGRWFMERK